MSGTEKTFHMTEQDVQKAESNTSKYHGGNIPKGSDAAMKQSIVDSVSKDKDQQIADVQANLPLPEQPPGSSDFNSNDERTVNVGSGGQPTENFSYGYGVLGEPSAGESVARVRGDEQKTAVFGQGAGREGVEGLGGLPNDAVSQGKKDKVGLSDTTNASSEAAQRAAGDK